MSRPDFLAAELLLAIVGREYLWTLAPAKYQGELSKLLGALLVLVLLSAISRIARHSALLTAVLLYAAYTQLQTALCVTAYVIEPWQIQAGQGMCSARIDFDLGAVGLLIVAAIAFKLSKSPDSYN